MDELLKRFYERTDLKDDTHCWNWNKWKDEDGYGLMLFKYKRYRAHRLSWELFKGPIPKGLCVCHHCDNPSCVNPAHLFVGTQKENTQDMINKGRSKRIGVPGPAPGRFFKGMTPIHFTDEVKLKFSGKNHGTHTKPESRSIGIRNGSAKLTEKEVLAIRKDAKDGLSRRELARKYSMSKRQLYKIIHRINWKHI